MKPFDISNTDFLFTVHFFFKGGYICVCVWQGEEG